MGDGTTLNIPGPVFDLAKDPKVAKSQRGIVRPLRTPGIDRFEVRDNDRVIETIIKSEVDYFYVDEVEPELSSAQQFEIILSLQAPVFVPGEKWQFLMGENRISALITDAIFNNRVFMMGERFGVGDKFKVLLRIEQYQTGKRQIRNRYEIAEVLRFWRVSEEPPLPFARSSDLPVEDEGYQ